MKLTRFQEYVRDEDIEADKSVFESKCFMADIKNDFCDTYQDLKIEIEQSIDMSEIIGHSLDFESSKIWESLEDKIKLRVNELINATQEEIEQFRIDSIVDNEPCDIESFKRDRELNQ